MANNVRNWKELWLRGMEAIGSAATSIANNTQYKVNEMNLSNRRREILADFGQLAYEEWLNGATFPPKMQALLEELNQLEEQLNVIAAEKQAKAEAKQQKRDVELDRTPEAPVIEVEEEEAKEADEEPAQPVGLLDRFFDKAEDAAEKLANAIPAEKIEEKTQSALDTIEKAFDRMTDAVESSIESFRKADEELDEEVESAETEEVQEPVIQVAEAPEAEFVDEVHQAEAPVIEVNVTEDEQA